MVRTVISLEEEDKLWLDQRAEEEGVPMAELVRRAVHSYRGRSPVTATESFRELLERSSGIWKGDEPLAHQERVRRGEGP